MNDMMFAVPPKSEYFDKKDIEIAQEEILLFCCLKNEAERIPYFLKYYREKGIKHFFIIDNASTDSSAEILLAQDDVHYFYTASSYKGSSAGRLWLQELCDYYGTGHWCLTADVDELLTFPNSEELSIPDLCQFLDNEGADGIFCVFLDMYSDRPLSETKYQPGEPFLNTCRYFEVDSYMLKPGGNPPFLNVFGGPRRRSLPSFPKTAGPMMKKIPLVKWREGFSYIYSTHSHRVIKLSSITGALLHFKFFDFFIELATRESKRGDRRQQQDYDHYAKKVERDPCFFGPHSLMYQSSRDLVQHGIVVTSEKYNKYAVSTGKVKEGQIGRPALQGKNGEENFSNPPMLNKYEELSLRQLPFIWPILNNPSIFAYFSSNSVIPSNFDNMKLLQDLRKTIKIVDVDYQYVYVFLPENLVYRHKTLNLCISCFAEGEFKFKVKLDGSDANFSIAENSSLPSVYKLKHNLTNDKKGKNHLFRDMCFYLSPDDVFPFDTGESRRSSESRQVLGAPLLTVSVFNAQPNERSVNKVSSAEMDGVVESVENGVARGWIRHKSPDKLPGPVAVFIDNQLVALGELRNARKDLKSSQGVGFGWKADLPLEYFYEQGRKDIFLDVRPLGTNTSLRRCPVPLQGRRSVSWSNENEEWAKLVNGSYQKVTQPGKGRKKAVHLRELGGAIKNIIMRARSMN
ncbi:glycosyltransferase family 2 protein [Roseibium sp. SCP14]|uniref:glycosyltransferase family 2 protein n=1 Tax=Roseibium sp. SCP14 TaxID=3141375 RepID=UPI003335AE46